MSYSLKRRLLTMLMVGLSVMFILLWLVVNRALRDLTTDYRAERMEIEVETLLAELELNEADLLSLNGDHVDALFHFAFSGYYYQIQWRGKEGEQMVRSRSLGEFILPIPPTTERKRWSFIQGPKGESLLMVVRHIPLREKKLTMAIAEDLTAMEEDLALFQQRYTMISLLFFILLTTIPLLAVGRALRPFDRVQQELAALESGGIRQLSMTVPREMQGMVERINLLLQRMEQRLARSRTTMGDLAHALKGPLTALGQIVHHPAVAADGGLVLEVEEQITVLNGLVERALRRARLADQAAPGRFFAPVGDIPPLVRTLKSIHFQKKVEVESLLPPNRTIPFDQEDMVELLGNLLDNACKWAVERVRLEILPTEKAVHLIIEDDGPGVAEAAREQIMQRGVRLDESRAGHGLGLAIVGEIVDHYRGELHFLTSSRLGGLRVEVMLPLE